MKKDGFSLYRSPIQGPDGSVYMYRYIAQTPWGTVRAHKIMRPDLAEDAHDHPWAFLSFLLTGRYVERVLTCTREESDNREKRAGWLLCAFLSAWNTCVGPRKCLTELPVFVPYDAQIPVDFVNQRFRAVFHFAEDQHRIVALPDGPVWTLLLTGPYERKWGFHTARGWVYWRDYEPVSGAP